MIAPLFAIAVAATIPPEIPGGAARPMLDYFTCLNSSERLRSIPEAADARQALVAVILRDCEAVRRESASSADAMLALDSRFADRDVRQSAVDSWLGYFEAGLRRRVIDRERFLEAVDAYEACLDRGESEC